MKTMNFKYKEYGDSIMLKMKDWRKITQFLTDHGVTVTENFSPGALKAMKHTGDINCRCPSCIEGWQAALRPRR
jgi:hypothetical protein